MAPRQFPSTERQKSTPFNVASLYYELLLRPAMQHANFFGCKNRECVQSYELLSFDKKVVEYNS